MDSDHVSDLDNDGDRIQLLPLGEQNALSNSVLVANEEEPLERIREEQFQMEPKSRAASLSGKELQSPSGENDTLREPKMRQNTIEFLGRKQTVKKRNVDSPDQEAESRSKKQIVLMAEMLTVLRNLDKRFESVDKRLKTLEKNSKFDHDEKPFPKHDLDKHDPVWHAVYETFSTTMKEKVDRWKGGMDSSLIFVGLFVTIITAFLVPVSQNLAPNPSDLTNILLANLTTIIYEIAVLNGMHAPSNLAQPETFHPALSDEIISLFLYSALLLSLITALFSVFGRQWAEHLTNRPKGQAYSEKSLRMDRRDELANKILKPILDSLHPILIFSIAFFIVGLLYQLWTMSLTIDKSVTLILTSSIGSGVILCATIATVSTVLHGGYCEESPFTMSTSSMIRRLVPKRFLKDFEVKVEWKDLVRLFCKSIAQMDSRDNYDHLSTVRLFCNDSGSKPESSVIDSVVHFLGSDASQKAKLTMAWNLLDIKKIGEEDFRKLRNALKSLEKDAPFNQEKVRVRVFFVGMVLFLRRNDLYVDVNAGSSFPDLEDIRDVFAQILTQKRGVSEFREDVLQFSKEDPDFFDDPDVKDRLLDAILIDDNRNWRDDWIKSTLPILTSDDVIELLHRISQKTENYLFYFMILDWIFHICEHSLHFPDDFNLSNFITFLSTYEDRYTDVPGFYRPPNRVLFEFCDRMNDALLSRQTGLSEFLGIVINDAPRDDWSCNKAVKLLKRLPASNETAPFPEQHALSSYSSLVAEYHSTPRWKDDEKTVNSHTKVVIQFS